MKGAEETMLNKKEIDILLVEDSPGDVRLAQEALKEGKVRNNLYIVGDGVEALDFLFRRGKHENAVRPDLILLDLNLPRLDGRSVLEQVKTDPDLRRIPVVVLTTSKAEQDVLKSYDLHANCYINKPIDFDQFITVIQSIENFWLSIVRLPQS